MIHALKQATKRKCFDAFNSLYGTDASWFEKERKEFICKQTYSKL